MLQRMLFNPPKSFYIFDKTLAKTERTLLRRTAGFLLSQVFHSPLQNFR